VAATSWHVRAASARRALFQRRTPAHCAHTPARKLRGRKSSAAGVQGPVSTSSIMCSTHPAARENKIPPVSRGGFGKKKKKTPVWGGGSHRSSVSEGPVGVDVGQGGQQRTWLKLRTAIATFASWNPVSAQASASACQYGSRPKLATGDQTRAARGHSAIDQLPFPSGSPESAITIERAIDLQCRRAART